MNKKFAYILQSCLDRKKLNRTQTVTKFIDKHGIEQADLDEIKNTPEINDFLKVFFQKNIKLSDKQVLDKFSELFSLIKVKSKEPSEIDKSFHAPEY